MTTSEVASQAKVIGMTPEERLEASIALQPVDRIACAPFVLGYAARFAGVTQKTFYHDFDLAMRCFDQVRAAYPVWDSNRCNFGAMAYAPILRNTWFQKVAIPGEELPEDAPFQIVEHELTTQDELRNIRTQGAGAYMMVIGQRLRPQAGRDHFQVWARERDEITLKEVQATYARGQSFFYGGYLAIGYELLSMTRSMAAFTRDVYKLGDELVEVLWAMQQGATQQAIDECRKCGVSRAFIVGCRCTPTFLNRKRFETFAWPFLKQGALDLLAAGITPIFHLDTDWGRCLEYFLELPKGKCVIETDGATNLFRAKQILRDHTCLSGDVPPGMLAIASPAEVEDYCKKLIREVGDGGGFIFSNGCTMPHDSKHANVKAMFDTVEKYGRCD
jgi:uroporphyrinogen decarboxylase